MVRRAYLRQPVGLRSGHNRYVEQENAEEDAPNKHGVAQENRGTDVAPPGRKRALRRSNVFSEARRPPKVRPSFSRRETPERSKAALYNVWCRCVATWC